MAKKKKKVKMRRGNFRRVTPVVADRYVKHWAKRGVTTPNEIPDSPSAKVERIRLTEASSVMREFQRKLDAYEQEKAVYEKQLAEFNALKKKGVFEHSGLPAQYVRPTAPTKPKMTGPRPARGGNFKRVSKKQAKAYLRRLFNAAAKNTVAKERGELKTRTGKKSDRVTMDRLPRGKKGKQIFSPRIKESILLLGPQEASELWGNAHHLQARIAKKAADKALAAEKRKKKADEAKLANYQKEIDRTQKRLQELENTCAAITAARRSRRSRRGRRQMRRRGR